MTMTMTAPFAQTPKTLTASVITAISGLGTDTITGAQLLLTAGINGSIVTAVTAVPRATVTASSLVLFLVKANALAIYRIIDSALMVAYTLSPTTAIPVTVFTSITDATPLRLESGDKLYAGSQVSLAAGIIFAGKWMDY